MKYIILMFTMVCAFAQETATDRAYKRLKAEKEASIKKLDGQYKKALEAIMDKHKKGLNSLKLRSMKEGNLELANKVDAEIKAIGNKDGKANTIKPAVAEDEGIVGVWKFPDATMTIKSDNSALYNTGIKGTWTLKGGVLTVTWENGSIWVYGSVDDKILSQGAKIKSGRRTTRPNGSKVEKTKAPGAPIKSKVDNRKSIFDIYE